MCRQRILPIFNCLRIWGGGYYPADEFYDLCDEYGILLWQDLMYACNIYDLTESFKENIVEEARDNILRFRNHASLGLICGNNELESAWTDWTAMKGHAPSLKRDYLIQFEYLLANVVKETAPDAFYWPSSPSSGGSFDKPNDDNRGDAHYWDVWHGQLPFSEYLNHYFRFCSEFGFQSLPSIKTIETFTEAKRPEPLLQSHGEPSEEPGSQRKDSLLSLRDLPLPERSLRPHLLKPDPPGLCDEGGYRALEKKPRQMYGKYLLAVQRQLARGFLV